MEPARPTVLCDHVAAPRGSSRSSGRATIRVETAGRKWMSESEEIWRAKADDELLEAREDLSEYTEEGERVIRAELQRRGLPKPDPPIGSCPACGRPVARYHQGDQCSQCGEPLPPDILRALGAVANESTDDLTTARTSD